MNPSSCAQAQSLRERLRKKRQKSDFGREKKPYLGRRRPAGWPRSRRWSTSTGYSGVVVVFDRCCAAVGLRGRRLASATRAHKHNESMGRRRRNTWISAASLRINFDAVFWVWPGRRSVRTRERAAQRHALSVSRKCDAKANVILRHIEGLMSDFDINLLEEIWCFPLQALFLNPDARTCESGPWARPRAARVANALARARRLARAESRVRRVRRARVRRGDR